MALVCFVLRSNFGVIMAIIPSYKEIISLMKKGLTLEAQEKIIELREIALQFQQENIEKKEEVNKLLKLMEIEKSISWEKPFYYTLKEKIKEGPFCQLCYDKNKNLIRLQNPEKGCFRCLACDNDYYTEDYNPSVGPVSFGSSRLDGIDDF